MYCIWHSCSKESAIYAIPGFLDLCNAGLFKRLLCKYYPEFVKACKKQPNKLDMRQFLVLLYG